MPIEVKVNGDHALHAASEIRNFCAFMQNSFAVPQPGNQPMPLVQPAIPAAPSAQPAATPAAPVAEPKKATAKKATAAPAAGPSLDDCMTRARGIAGDGQNKEITDKLKAINTHFGIERVRDLQTPEHYAEYMAKLDEVFPPQAAKAAETTDAAGIF